MFFLSDRIIFEFCEFFYMPRKKSFTERVAGKNPFKGKKAYVGYVEEKLRTGKLTIGELDRARKQLAAHDREKKIAERERQELERENKKKTA